MRTVRRTNLKPVVAKCTRGVLGRLLLAVTSRAPGSPRRGNGAHSAPALSKPLVFCAEKRGKQIRGRQGVP